MDNISTSFIPSAQMSTSSLNNAHTTNCFVVDVLYIGAQVDFSNVPVPCMYVLRIQHINFISYTIFSGFAPLEVICMVLCVVVLYNGATADHDIVIMCPECSPDTSTPPYWAP